jgi:hypothetical protein|tara:strand:+ start:71 stop:244 length:174 start_codon:yes stop_codon:yes gene_type:complete
MAKYKAKKAIDRFDCYKGLKIDDWRDLNAGKVVDLDKVPNEAKEYLEEVKQKIKESK